MDKLSTALEALSAERFAGSASELSDLASDVEQVLKVLFDAARLAESDGVASASASASAPAVAGSKGRKRSRPSGDGLRLGSGKQRELCVRGFESEQVWAMIDMENAPLLASLERAAQRLASLGADEVSLMPPHLDEELSEDEEEDDENSSMMMEDDDEGEEGEEEDDDDDDDNKDDEGEDEEDGDEEEEDEGSEEEEEEEKKEAEGADNDEGPTEMDEGFFKFSEMEAFTESVEQDDADMKTMLAERASRKSARQSQADDYSDDGEGVDDEDDEEGEDDGDEDDGDEDDEDGELQQEGAEDEDGEEQEYSYRDFFGNIQSEAKSKSKSESKGRKKKQKREEEEEEEEEHQGEDEDEEHQDEEGDADAEEDADMENTGQEEQEGEQSEERLSRHEKRQLELRKQIEDIESDLIAEKSWDMRGESKARARPANSLLEKGGDVDVEYLSRPAPVVTEVATQSLEDMIRQRILDSDFDDVVRKLPMEQEADYERPLAELSMEKSKAGLGDEYAKDYQVKVMGATPEEDTRRAAEEAELHEMFSNLCHKLDSLANLHYTPKAPKVEDGFIKPLNVAAIGMEESLPVAMSAASQAAPEQILAKRKGLGKSTEELDQAERKRARQQAKTAKRARHRHKAREERVLSKLQPGMGNKHAIAKHARTADAADDSASDGKKWTSAAFFKDLQDGAVANKHAAPLTKPKPKAASLRL